ncbi:arsenate reductase ArsC [Pseudomonas fluorescens]|uniref:ArsC family transcriptional regulator n=1 Tax=Pseudomonas fluorescens TaxID=294 RepID=A0A0D0MT74_PSEFL|nr:arsenate reductase ArsC [Pseudomonas fluorescens]KIQ58670.1 ArsC family transcriptional regulator [Pseudomonas fluorescens]
MRILFMCTANSCRSVLSEGLFNHMAPEAMSAISSGSVPSGCLNPRAVSTLQNLGIDTSRLYSKGSESFADNPPDIVITVCDKARGEPCPIYFGPAIKSHWGLADPSDVLGSDEEVQAAFDATVAKIRQRFAAFLALDISALGKTELKQALDAVGEL